MPKALSEAITVTTSYPKRLRELLASLSPELKPDGFVFVAVTQKSHDLSKLDPIAWFHEDEGTSAIIPEENAEEFDFETIFRCIKLGVDSKLNDVGLTAAVSNALANAGISANVVAALRHDYIFVPESHAEQAVEVLKKLSKQSDQ